VSEPDTIPPPARRVARIVWRHREASATAGERAIPEELAVSFDFDGVGYAVMMASPVDLEDFAVGFSLTETIITSPDEIEELSVLPHGNGVVIRIGLTPARRDAVWERRRYLAGPSGCGLCGIDSLDEALRACPIVTSDLRVSATTIAAAMGALAPHQTLNRETRAVHAAGFWQVGTGIATVREDVGRHNALDKLVGALARQNLNPASGITLLTSRISVEMVQKAAIAGTPILAAVSAPTALAIRTAEAANITLVGIARDDGFEIFTHPDRITLEPAEDVA